MNKRLRNFILWVLFVALCFTPLILALIDLLS
jgi:hypothetical protein